MSYCPYCGKKIEDENVGCRDCNYRLGDAIDYTRANNVKKESDIIDSEPVRESTERVYHNDTNITFV